VIITCIALLTLTLVLALPQLGYSHSSSAVSGQQSGIALTLTESPPILPSDGGTYQSLVLEFKNETSGLPFIPQNNVTIYMSSTNLQAGTVPTTVVFPAGSLFVHASFTTTSSPAITSVNAFATGYSTASAQVTTSLAEGIPTALEVFLNPSQIPPNEKFHSIVIVQAVDINGNPVKLGSALTVSLSSSTPEFGSVPSSLTIATGNSYGETTFSPTFVAGSTTITASAPGLRTGSNTMTTTGVVAGRVVVSAAPSIIAANLPNSSVISIQLQDNRTQTPAVASSAVTVVVSSSNQTVVNPPLIVTIPAGLSYTSFMINGGAPGTATITASPQGYSSGSVLITVENPASSANSLAVSFAPQILLPNNATYNGMVAVQLEHCVGNTCTPATNTTATTVYTRSSNNATMQVSTRPLTINAGSNVGFTNITSTFLPGSAIVTAQGRSLSATSVSLASSGLVPNSLSIQVGPQILLADGEKYDFITIGLINSQTQTPEPAPVSTTITLSSTVNLGVLQNIVTIQAGQTFANTSLTSSLLPGSTRITATASNYTTANATLTLISPPATNLALYASPGEVLANGQAYQNLIVQLQNGPGYPEKTDAPITVELTTNNLAIGQVPIEVTVPAGSTFTAVNFSSTNTPGVTSITAFANGFQSATASVNSTLLPFSAQLTLSSAYLAYGAKSTAVVNVESNGAPLNGALLSWTSSGGSLSGESSTTNSNGVGSATFQAGSVNATFHVQVQVSMSGYKNYTASAIGTVYNPSGSTQPKGGNSFISSIPVIGPYLAMTVLSVPVWILIPVVVGAGGISAFMVRRLLYGSVEYEEEEE
jgi:hypothetical protein